jgi:hypothetical protein
MMFFYGFDEGLHKNNIIIYLNILISKMVRLMLISRDQSKVWL